MKTILVLHTGGTISMSKEADGNVTTNNMNPLLDQEELLAGKVNLIVEPIFNIPSPHMTLERMLELKERIQKAYTEEIDGVVITHGTDTLEETAYFLDITLENKIPVVLTGAMRSSNEIGTDGLYNFISAVWTACSDESFGKGVLVVMNDEIHTARYVTKTHTTNVATFRTPTFGPIGMIAKERTFFASEVRPQEICDIEEVTGEVYVIKAYAGMDGSLFDLVDNDKTDGIVIEALGAGNLPPETLPSLERLLARNIPIVLVSRCSNGIAEDIYDYEGGGVNLKKMGIVFSRGLNGPKARIRLIVGLNSGKDSQSLFDFLSE
ncbi:L-asparaginase, type II [Enterococcus haemoperoxidus ATCC BAA-382]|uniref:asparaginase n=1 Tax=Enterococcus haemoperoxidus ATCC BAA-382 TaxID=1158608 RepID=R2QSS0_9ENTE|nr:asparaginase [Enterococcus haemoperoxidus]EOH99567.1 L-asparaginase, type II [Enterococcus haemoperoxidus ATCC BAA-382]EOT62693.1 L-asparaginase [Enterococcus haemoperoxidus ATCC BAA-382]